MNSRDKGAKEVWKDIPGYIGLYQVSSMGRVRSLKRATTGGRILKPYINKWNGYCTVSLSNGNKRVTKRVHKLVMMAFKPRNCKTGYDKESTINHIDGDKTNNSLQNLEWCTQSENQIKAYEIGINGKSCRAVINLDTLEVFGSVGEAAESVGGKKPSSISRVCKGQRSNYRNAHFAYYQDYINGTVPAFNGKARRSTENLWR